MALAQHCQVMALSMQRMWYFFVESWFLLAEAGIIALALCILGILGLTTRAHIHNV